MKNLFALTMVLLIVFAVAPAMADDGQVSDATLSALGLGSLEVMSDAEGLEVRGLSSMATAAGTSLVFGQLVYNDGKYSGFMVGSDVNTAGGSANAPGAMAAFADVDTIQGSAIFGELEIENDVADLFEGSFAGIAGFGALGGLASAIADSP